MIFVIDIGNSNITLGVFNNEKLLLVRWRLSTNKHYTEDDFASLIISLFKSANIDQSNLEGAVISSVVKELTMPMAIFIEKYFKFTPLIVSEEINHDLNLDIYDSTALGSDILANAVAARFLFSKRNLIVVDLGTALTVSAVTKERKFLGVSISAGLFTSYDALIENTGINSVAMNKNVSILGKNTSEAVSSGILNGYVAAIDGMVKEVKRQNKTIKFYTIITGGASSILQDMLKVTDFYEPNLTLQGLFYLYKLNKKKNGV